MNMLYSVIIPVYNVESYLNDCIKSILEKDYSWEVICVNDGSTDNSLKILKDWERISNIKVVNQQNKGLSVARNEGLRHSNGKYVAFIDSDDYINASQLHDLFVKASQSEVDIAIGDFYHFYEGDESKQLHTINAEYTIQLGKDFFAKFYKPLQSVVVRNVYRRDFLQRHNIHFTEGIYFEDVIFTPIAFMMASKVLYTQIPFYYYRKRNNSITTSSSSLKKIKDSISVWINLNSLSSQQQISSTIKSIINDIAFHVFLLQFSNYQGKIPQSDWEIVINLSKLKFYSLKYKCIAFLFRVLKQHSLQILFKILKKRIEYDT